MRPFYPRGGYWHEEGARTAHEEPHDPARGWWADRDTRDRWDTEPLGARPTTIRRAGSAEVRRATATQERGYAWSGPREDLPRQDLRRQSPTFDPDRAGYRSPLESAGDLRAWHPRPFERPQARAAGEADAERPVSRPPARYTRPDERIRDDVYDRLMGDTGIDASDVDVIVKNGEVTLSGTVRDRLDKRRLEELVEGVLGVRDVHNQLRRATDHPTDRTRLPS